MTLPLTQSMLKAEMETLAKVCIIIQAAAVDSLIHNTHDSYDWNMIAFMCQSVVEHIYQAMETLHDLTMRLKDQP